MNLGRLLGEQQLRIHELEEQLEKKQRTTNTSERAIGTRVEGVEASVAVAHEEASDPRPASRSPRRKASIPIWPAIVDVLRSVTYPMTIDQLACAIPTLTRVTIANNVATRTAQGSLTRHGSGKAATYELRRL